jgi:hypothetical protein
MVQPCHIEEGFEVVWIAMESSIIGSDGLIKEVHALIQKSQTEMGICGAVPEACRREVILLCLGNICLQLCNHAQVDIALLKSWVVLWCFRIQDLWPAECRLFFIRYNQDCARLLRYGVHA